MSQLASFVSSVSSRLSSGRRQVVAGVVAAVLLLLVGYGVGALTTRTSNPGGDSAEAGFARDMSEHHAQAVEIGMIAYQKASLPEIRTLGGDIAITQQGQIGMMKTWLQSWGLDANSSALPMSWMPEGERALNGNLMPGMATRDEINKLNGTTGKDVDILFCQYMLRHHLGGVHMVDGLLRLSPDPQVAALAETMKRNQTNEIQILTNLLDKLGAEPLP